MRLLFLGDVVGRSGRQVVLEELPKLRARYKLDFVAINGENAAGGFGITEAIWRSCSQPAPMSSRSATTPGIKRRRWCSSSARTGCCGPINYPPGTPGKGAGLFKARNGAEVLVINAMGLIFMPELDCPFRAVDRELDACGLKQGADAILIDFHAEATSEKQAMGYYVDGRASCVVGTHTHAPTADERVLPRGTAFVSDIGMCGDYKSVLGMDPGEPLNRFLTKIPRGQFEPAMGPATISGLAVEIDDSTGLALRTAGLRLGGVLAPTEPLFWVE